MLLSIAAEARMGGGGVGFAVVCEAEEEKSGFRGDFCDAMSRLSNSREMPDLM
jgi:hypothetical protein